MARRAASITQADVARAIRAAKQAGAAEVEVRIGSSSAIIIRIAPSTGTEVSGLEQSAEIVL
jgi:DNA-binding XRE family transcriptional regulator